MAGGKVQRRAVDIRDIPGLGRLLGGPSHRSGSVLMVQLLFQGLTTDEIYEVLRTKGFTDRAAARIVTFLPSAFARVFYRDTGYGFPDHFYEGVTAYEKQKATNYSREPLFQDAMQLAEQMRRDGDWNSVFAIVELSAEHRCIEKARQAGLTPLYSSAIIYNF